MVRTTLWSLNFPPNTHKPFEYSKIPSFHVFYYKIYGRASILSPKPFNFDRDKMHRAKTQVNIKNNGCALAERRLKGDRRGAM